MKVDHRPDQAMLAENTLDKSSSQKTLPGVLLDIPRKETPLNRTKLTPFHKVVFNPCQRPIKTFTSCLDKPNRELIFFLPISRVCCFSIYSTFPVQIGLCVLFSSLHCIPYLQLKI